MPEQRATYRVTYTDDKAVKRAIRQEGKRLIAAGPGPYAGPEPGLIRALIEQQGWSQTDVAAVLRVDVSTVRRWCADRAQRQAVGIPFSAWWLLLQRAGAVSPDSLDRLDSPAF